MRTPSTNPGRQLGSNSLRYRLPGRYTQISETGTLFASPLSWSGIAHRSSLPEQPQGPAAHTPAMARLEAVLFLAREPLSTRKLAKLANLADGTEARSLLRKLRTLYDKRGCAFQAEEVAGGFQLLTRAKFARWLRRLEHVPEELRLSGPSLETLAVVAYRQPVLRVEIEAIRGVQCGEILRQLMERDLVKIAGRSSELGRPFLYGTTRRFLQAFGLRDLDQLPRAAQLRPSAKPSPAEVAKESADRDDRPFSENSTKDEGSPEEVSAVRSQGAKPSEQNQEHAQLELDAGSIVAQAIDPHEPDEEEYEFEEEYDFEDDDDDEDDTDDEDEVDDEEEWDDEDEDDEDEDDLEGDWEEVDDEELDDDDELDDDEELEEDELDEDDEEDWEDDDEEAWDEE